MNVQGWVRQVGAGEDGPRSDQGNHHSTWPTPAAVRGSRPPSRFPSQQSGPDQASRVSSPHSGRDHLNEAHIVRWPPDSSHHHTLGLYDSGEHDSRAHRLCKEPLLRAVQTAVRGSAVCTHFGGIGGVGNGLNSRDHVAVPVAGDPHPARGASGQSRARYRDREPANPSSAR